jgi:hypothetical protein
MGRRKDVGTFGSRTLCRYGSRPERTNERASFNEEGAVVPMRMLLARWRRFRPASPRLTNNNLDSEGVEGEVKGL